MDNNEHIEDFSDIHERANNLPQDSKLFISHSLDIAKSVSDTLEKTGKSQKWLAETLKKSEAEISKWLSGSQNFTLRSISKLEAALSLAIINPRISFFLDKCDSPPDFVLPTINLTVNQFFEIDYADLIGVPAERGYMFQQIITTSDTTRN